MYKALLLSIITIALLSCKSKQALTQQNKTPQFENCATGNLSKEEITDYCDSLGLDYEWLKVKTKIKTNYKGQDLSFIANFRIKKDSLVYISLSKAGIPVAKVLATPDSIKTIDLIHKTYRRDSFKNPENLQGQTIPFEILENLLLGQPSFLFEKTDTVISDSGVVKFIGMVPSKGDSSQTKQEIVFACDTIAYQATQLIENDKKLNVDYSNLEDINDVTLNKNIKLKATEADKVVILADIEILKVKTYSSLKIPFNIPSDYDEMGTK